MSMGPIRHGVEAGTCVSGEPSDAFTPLMHRRYRLASDSSSDDTRDLGEAQEHRWRGRNAEELLREYHHGLMNHELRRRPGTASRREFSRCGFGVTVAHKS